MKKVKVMMTAIGILAVVGGALAFKASTYTSSFCVLNGDNGQPGICTASFTGKVTNAVAAGTFYYTTPTTRPTLCTNGEIECPVRTKLTTVEP